MGEAAGVFNPGGTPRSDCCIVFKSMKRVEMRPSAFKTTTALPPSGVKADAIR